MVTPHLDDEALSAAVDGAATATEAGHLAWCAECSARMASLAAVAHAVGAPVTPRPSREVDDAVGRALAAWSPSDRADPGPPDAEGGAWTPGPGTRPKGRTAGRPVPWLGAAVGVAAAVIVVAGLVAVIRATSGSVSRRTSTAAAPSVGLSTTTVGPRADFALGDQSDPAALARQIAGTLNVASGANSVAPASGSRSAPAPTTTCEVEARTVLAAGTAPLAYAAPLQWQGQPAVALVFSTTQGRAGVVMMVPGCSVLATLPF